MVTLEPNNGSILNVPFNVVLCIAIIIKAMCETQEEEAENILIVAMLHDNYKNGQKTVCEVLCPN